MGLELALGLVGPDGSPRHSPAPPSGAPLAGALSLAAMALMQGGGSRRTRTHGKGGGAETEGGRGGEAGRGRGKGGGSEGGTEEAVDATPRYVASIARSPEYEYIAPELQPPLPPLQSVNETHSVRRK
jgi:hypothetical protein